MIGFSAGGHLVAAVSTHFDKRLYPAVDDADKESSRPDFALALYPGHLLEHASKDFELNPAVPVTAQTPPTFLVQAEDDDVDDMRNSLVYYAEESGRSRRDAPVSARRSRLWPAAHGRTDHPLAGPGRGMAQGDRYAHAKT